MRNQPAIVFAAILTLQCLAGAGACAATYGQQVVAAVLMGEAWGEGRVGMIAVAEVIRTRADQEGISPLAVVKKPLQFTSLNGTSPQRLIRKYQEAREWPVALEIARTMYNTPDQLPGITRGADHFDHGVPYWARNKTPVAVIGRHKFYRLN